MTGLKRLFRGAWLRFQNVFILKRATKEIQDKQFISSESYGKYLKEQLVHTVGLRTKDAAFRYNKFISEFLKALPDFSRSGKVLCVGCRNLCEIDAFEHAGFASVTGVDLFSTDPRILVMDMHELKFPDNSFDILYCAATFEKAYDPMKVANEFIRVLKNGGVLILQVGANYQTGPVDRHDFKQLSNLYSFFKSNMKKVYFEEEELHSLQTIFEIAK